MVQKININHIQTSKQGFCPSKSHLSGTNNLKNDEETAQNYLGDLVNEL